MNKYLISGVITLTLAVFEFLVQYSLLDFIQTKLRTQGSGGAFMANFLISPYVLLALFVTACALLFKAVKERRQPVPKIPTLTEELVRASRALESRNSLPQPIIIHNENKPVFHNTPQINQNPLQIQSQSSRQLQSINPIEIKALPAKMRDTFVTVSGEATDQSESLGMENGKLPVAFAEIYRGADRSQEPFVDIRAHILFLDENETLLHRVNDAWWWKSHRHHATFRPGDSRRLVVAVVSEKKKLFPYDGQLHRIEATYETNEKYLVIGDDSIDGNNFRVKIELIGTRGSVTTFSDSFEYDLTVEPPTFSLRN